MCFSATASFGVSVVLLPVGIYCIKKALSVKSAYLFFALIPAFFAIQQLFEGLVWLGLESGDDGLVREWALGFLFFSHLFWLIWVPLSCYAVEGSEIKRKFFLLLVLLGTAHGLSMYVPLWFHADWLAAEIVGHSIHYKYTLLHDELVPIIGMNIIYALVVLVPLLVAGDRYIRIFGALIVASLAVTSLYFEYAYISVWCFFAAIMSLYLLLMIIQKTELPVVKNT